MNDLNINLNLLKVLSALLQEVHVTAAGRKVNLTQAATSNALKQLRAIFQDPLLVRGQGGQMTLSPLAESLKPRVRLAIEQLQGIFDVDKSFVARESTRVFNVGMNDYFEFVLLPMLIERIANLAPQVKLNAFHMNSFNDTSLLSEGRIDLVLGNFPNIPQNLMTQALFTDMATFVARKNHPIFKDQHVKFKDMLEYQFIMVSFMEDPKSNYLDHLFKRANLDKRVSVTVPHAMTALHSIAHSNLITHTCCHIARPFASNMRLTLINKPTGMPKLFTDGEYQAKQYWHKSQQQDPGHQWLRQQIKHVADEL